MAGSKEIRNKIKSVQSTRKITKAMEMVAASKMKKAQDRMRASRPVRRAGAADRDAHRQGEHRVPASVPRAARGVEARRRDRRHHRQGPVRRPQHQRAAARAAAAQGMAGEGHRRRLRRDRQQGPGLPAAAGRQHRRAAWSSSATGRTWTSWSVRSRCCSTNTSTGTIDEVHIFFTTFINTMKQEAAARHDAADSRAVPDAAPARCARPDAQSGSWDYIYEPDAKQLLDGVLRRYVEALDLPDGQREHGLRAVGADGGDEGRLRQRGARSSTSCSSSTTRRGRRRSPRNSRRSSAAPRRSERKRSTLNRRFENEEANMNQGTIVQCIGAVVDVEFPRDQMPEHLRRAEDGRDRADARGAAAAGRRRRAHDRARLAPTACAAA